MRNKLLLTLLALALVLGMSGVSFANPIGSAYSYAFEATSDNLFQESYATETGVFDVTADLAGNVDDPGNTGTPGVHLIFTDLIVDPGSETLVFTLLGLNAAGDTTAPLLASPLLADTAVTIEFSGLMWGGATAPAEILAINLQVAGATPLFDFLVTGNGFDEPLGVLFTLGATAFANNPDRVTASISISHGVPEPALLALMAPLAGLAVVIRRRR